MNNDMEDINKSIDCRRWVINDPNGWDIEMEVIASKNSDGSYRVTISFDGDIQEVDSMSLEELTELILYR